MPARGVVGLDIGTAGVRAAELTGGSGKTPLTLQRFGQVALPAGAVVGGQVSDPEAVAGALVQLWSSVKFSSRKVVIGMANQQVVVRQVDLPWMPEKELRRSLVYQVADVIPMALDQAIVDFHPLEEFTSEDGARMVRVMLVAAVREMVSTCLRAVELAKLDVSMIDLTPFALLRGIVDTAATSWEPEVEGLVEVGASVTNIVVHEAGLPRFVRILAAGGHDITGAVGERMGVSFEDAELVKQQLGLAMADTLSTFQHPASGVIDTAVGSWVEEVRGSLDYYLSQPGARPLRRIVLSGGGARLGGLAGRLAAATRLEVVPSNPLGGLRLGKTGLSDEQLAYIETQVAVPVGLALGRVA